MKRKSSLWKMKMQFLHLFGLIAVLVSSGVASAQVGTVPQLLKQQPQWKKLAQDGTRLNFDARFQGRAGDLFRVEKLDVEFRLPSTIRLPDRLKDGQRLEITGKFVLNSGKLSFVVSHLLIRETDSELLAERVATIPDDQADRLLAVADEFMATAEFYEDKGLISEVAELRTRGVDRLRKMASDQLEELREVKKKGETLQVNQQLLDLIQFQILMTEWQRPGVDLSKLIVDVKNLAGWDLAAPAIPARIKSAFPAMAVALYESASADDRKWLHRMLYAVLRLQQILQMLKVDGSNGLAMAKMLRTEFPDEAEKAASLESREVEYRMGRTADLSRQELQELSELLESLSQKAKIPGVLQDWLKAQEKRFGTTELAGLLRTADEHLFVAEHWKEESLRQRGIELLKQAWEIAANISPDDATQIGERLRRLGWEHLNGQWMTLKQLESLPKDDVQLAIREGRVVRGMTGQQVTQTLGRPSRISRMGSSRTMRELWIYDADGTGASGLVVRFRRSVVIKSDVSLVEDVSKIGSQSNR